MRGQLLQEVWNTFSDEEKAQIEARYQQIRTEIREDKMDAYHFKTVVESNGSVVLSGLPPSQEVEIIVVKRNEPSDEIRSWFQDIRTRHPFAKMSKQEILKALQKTRETVWAERHAS